MLKNRKAQMLLVIALIATTLVASITAVKPTAPSVADLSWEARPDFSAGSLPIVPVSGASEYSDYYQRHAALPAATTKSTDLTDYFRRHPELHRVLVEIVDECFDVSLSEVAACREASQSPSP